MKPEEVHSKVKKAYGDAAKGRSCCCSGSSCCGPSAQPVPESDLGLSCGDPVAFSKIKAGDTVLDLGSGAGKDVFLAARKAGPDGHVIGLDMTEEMLELAARNAEKFAASTGLANVEFRKGCIEEMPIADAAIDRVISNCVINLSPDKPRVFREAFRVLKPGGSLLVSDIVLEKPLPKELEDDVDLYSACIAGALPRKEYLDAITAAGFTEVELLADHLYKVSHAQGEPITGPAACALDGVASSLTIAAKKTG